MEKIVLMVEFIATMKNNNKPRKAYFLYFQHFATCEGMTDSCGLVFAHSKKKAIAEFLRKGMMNDLADEKHIQEGIDYFSVGVVAYDMNIKKNIPKIKDILKDYVSSNVVEAIIDANESHALHEFHFHLYRNFS